MSYVLEAFIGREAIVATAAAIVRRHRVSRLDRNLHMVELGDHDPDEPLYSDQFYNLTVDLASAAATASHLGDIAYIEAEFFGGEGSQSCIIWRGGEVVFGPLRADDEDPPVPPLSDWPINRALRYFGIRAGDGQDEFDTVGLSRFR